MVLFKDYRKPEAEPGEWCVFADDPDNGLPVKFRIRPIPMLVSRKFATSKGRDERVTLKDEKGKERAALQRLYNTDESIAVMQENVVWCCTEVENLQVQMMDAGSRDFFASQTGVAGLEVGATVTLDGCWNDAVKRYVFSRYPDLGLWVFKEADRIEEERKVRKDTDEGNS
jgi:hypothetical protein